MGELLELWGGHECTVNRVRNRYLDQSVLSGHEHRMGDLQMFAGLGLKALRYPVLWEKVSPHPGHSDFSWAEERLGEIRRLGVRPIVGLTHHGSGPAHTSLVDDHGFAAGLAQHARATAERFPWVRDWTPVNEPLTTARFSALYGIWYPHARNEGAFWRALLNQIDATRLAMRQIRLVNPEARLVQTEDLGFCHATEPMAAQAAYENERRWITWDLLCGRVTPEHPLWSRLAAWGLAGRLAAIADDPCPPDIIGVNHYLSSERLLDHRVELYPDSLRGGDGPGAYVNIEAVRTVRSGCLGVGTLLTQTWERYGREIAVTECHNGCTREEQMRWFEEVWRGVEDVRRAGVPVRAVTAWGLLGSYDWNRLLTEEAGHYEVGVYDLRSGEPRPTTMAPLLQSLAAGSEPSSPLLDGVGWWRREDRFVIQAISLPEPCPKQPLPPLRSDAPRPLLLAGTGCAVTEAVLDACKLRGLAVAHVPPPASAETFGELITEHAPWAVFSLCGARPGDDAVAAACEAAGAPFASWMAAGAARTRPSEGELLVLAPELIGHHDLHEFARNVLEALGSGGRFRAAANRPAPGGYLPDAVHAVLDLLMDGHAGVVNLAVAPGLPWAELATLVANEGQLDAFQVEPVAIESIGRGAREPRAHHVRGLTVALPDLANAARRAVAGWRLTMAGRDSCPAEAGEEAEAALRHAAE